MKILAIANNKGGCGKTATAYNLGLILADFYRVLLIDLDPQANLTERFFTDGQGHTIADVLSGAEPPSTALMQRAIRPTGNVDGHSDITLDICPGEFQLANVAFGLLNDAVRGRTALRRALRTVADCYDLCIIDCPPEAGILLVNALLAAEAVICPAEPEEAAFAGVRRVCEMVGQIREEYGSDRPFVLGNVATKADLRTNRHLDGLQVLEASSVAPLLATIPERNGQGRDRDLRTAYEPVAEHIAVWMERTL